MNTHETAAQRIERVAYELGLTMTAEFVPFSKSRNAAEKWQSLNWKVSLKRKGEQPLPCVSWDVLTTEYSAGVARCPAYKATWHHSKKWEKEKALAWECENGKAAHINNYGEVTRAGPPLQPNFADVIASLVRDYNVLDEGSFENWAESLGYDTDSRKAEAIHRACVDIALKLRAAIGDDGMAKLRAACQDY